MLEQHTSDLHHHLNGSFSLGFLERKAQDNGCPEVYEAFSQIIATYLHRTQHQPADGYSEDIINMVWKLFGLIHKIIQKLEDISDGVLDVVQQSDAKYLEIRTTPKSMENKTLDDYITAFEKGLCLAHEQIKGKKAVGLLSLDRTIHTLQDVEHFIQRIHSSPYLVGLDISGNPMGKRTLTGDALGETILLALNSGISIAIHMGEVDTLIEKNDIDIILSALEAWVGLQPLLSYNPLHGKVRLGHCIFLTEEQQEKIAALGIPIEICASCHKHMNWHLETSPHPVTGIYADVKEALVSGTDDQTIFGSSAKDEFNHLLSFFPNKEGMSRKEIKEHQATFRFS